MRERGERERERERRERVSESERERGERERGEERERERENRQNGGKEGKKETRYGERGENIWTKVKIDQVTSTQKIHSKELWIAV